MSYKIWFLSALNAALLLLHVGQVVEASNVGSVTQVPTVAYLQTHDLTRSPNLAVAGFATDIDGGGGMFTMGVAGCTDDGGVVLKDSANNCFYRRFVGPVSTKWYGAADAASSACQTTIASCDAAAILTKAFAAAGTYGNRVVTTDSRAIAVTSASVTIPAHHELTCAAPPGGRQDEQQISSYYALPNSIVIDPTRTIIRSGNTRLTSCILRPSTLVADASPPIPVTNPTIRDLINWRRTWVGNPTSATEVESAMMDNMFIYGFDICENISGTPRTVLSDIWMECNNGMFIHGQREGMKLQNVVTKTFLSKQRGCRNPVAFGGDCTDQGNIASIRWPITSVANNGGLVQITLASYVSGTIPPNQVIAGDRVLINGLGVKGQFEVRPSGLVTAGSSTLTAVGLEADGTIDANAGFISYGNLIYYDAAPGCIPAGTYVTNIVDGATAGTFTVTMSANADAGCPASVATAPPDLRFKGASTAPPSGNDSWVVQSVSGQNIVLKGSLWAGPTYDSEWVADAKAITVFDTTNIKIGQYICASPLVGTLPFCTAPVGFIPAAATLTQTITNVYVGQATVSTTENWPRTGLIMVGTEIICYRVRTTASIDIELRGCDGSTAAGHTSGDALTVAPPTVEAIIPKVRADLDNYVIASSSATTSSSVPTAIKFANDTTVNGTYIGQLSVIVGYRNWTHNVEALGAPGSLLTVTGSVASGGTAMTVTANGHKIFPGMTVTNVATPADLAIPTTVTAVSGNNITISPAAIGTVTAETLIFDGCGFPVGEPWLGNCSGVDLLLGGNYPVEDQGVTAEWMHTSGAQIAIRIHNSRATQMTNTVAANGGSSGCARDISCTTLWVDGDSDTTNFVNGQLKGGYIGVLNTPTKNNDGTQVTAMHIGTEGLPFANVGASTNLTLIGIHAKGDNFAFAGSDEAGLVVSSSNMSGTELVYDNPSVLSTIRCSANVMYTDTCGTPSLLGFSSNIATVDTVAALDAGDYAKARTLFLRGYYVVNDGGGGWLNYATGLTENNIDVFCAGTRCFKRAETASITAKQGGAYCNAQKFNSLGTTTAASTTITTGSHQAVVAAIGRTVVMPTSGGTTFYPGNTVTVTAGGTSGYAVGDTVTLTGGTGTPATLTVSAVSAGVITAVRFNNRAAYGAYTGTLPANPVAQGSTSGAGVGTPTFTLTWQGDTALVTTITAVGTNTLTLAAAPTVTQNTIPTWAYGNLDATKLQAYIDWAEARTGTPVLINGLCMVETRIDMPASTTNVATMFGQGASSSGLISGATPGTMVNLLRRTTPFGLSGGGIQNMLLDGSGITSGPVLYVNSGSDMNFSNIQVLNATGAANWNIEDTGGTNGPKWNGIRARYESTMTGARAPQYNFKATGEAGTYFMVDASGAADVQFYFDTRGNASYIHTQSPGGLPRPNYGMQVANGGVAGFLDIDGAIIADLYVSGRYSSILGGNMNCGNDGTLAATSGVLLANALKDASITGISFDNDCAWTATAKIALAGTLDQSSRVFGNGGAGLVQLYSPGTVLPQGRLSCSATTPVMAADVASCTTVYYLPYVGNRVPTFAGLTASSTASYLVSYNIGSGLSIALDSTTGHTNDQAASAAYDIYKAQDNSGVHYLCTGTGWTASAYSSAVAITRTGSEDLVRDATTGLWVNAEAITDCRWGSGSGNTIALGINQGVYLGTLYATANGVTTMTFAPAAASGGSNAILALYNAYNKVPMTSTSRDSAGLYAYSTAAWRSANNSASNRVSWLDGLGDVYARASLTTRVIPSGVAACLGGINFNSTSATPSLIVEFSIVDATVGSLYGHLAATASSVPTLGFSYAQAMENADPSGGGTCTWGGSGYQSLSWQGAY